MSNSITTSNAQIVTNAFNELNNINSIVSFMLDYFKNFIVTRSQPNNLDFKPSIDTVNRELINPIDMFMKSKERLSELDRSKIELWSQAHRKFEIEVIAEVSKLITKNTGKFSA